MWSSGATSNDCVSLSVVIVTVTFRGSSSGSAVGATVIMSSYIVLPIKWRERRLSTIVVRYRQRRLKRRDAGSGNAIVDWSVGVPTGRSVPVITQAYVMCVAFARILHDSRQLHGPQGVASSITIAIICTSGF